MSHAECRRWIRHRFTQRFLTLLSLCAACALALAVLMVEPVGESARGLSPARGASVSPAASSSCAAPVTAALAAPRGGSHRPELGSLGVTWGSSEDAIPKSAAEESAHAPGTTEATDEADEEASAPDERAVETDEPRVEVIYMKRTRLVELVSKGLEDREPIARIDALRLVRANTIPEVEPQVERLALEDRDALVRRFAAQVIALGDPAQKLELLERLLQDGDVGVRANAACGLARRGDPRGATQLAACLESARHEGSPLAGSIEKALAAVLEN